MDRTVAEARVELATGEETPATPRVEETAQKLLLYH
jgi:hypothetical protein